MSSLAPSRSFVTGLPACSDSISELVSVTIAVAEASAGGMDEAAREEYGRSPTARSAARHPFRL
jgi:hypothetical protein